MFEIVKRTLLTGVGLAAMTKDKVEELGRELAKRGEMSEQEGQAFVDDLLKKSEEARGDFEEKLSGIVKKVLSSANMATKSDIDELTKKIERLEAQLASKDS